MREISHELPSGDGETVTNTRQFARGFLAYNFAYKTHRGSACRVLRKGTKLVKKLRRIFL